jgi:hypothetical protein
MQRKEDSVQNGVSTVTLDDLIKAALTGQRYNQQRLGTQARLYARRLSNIYASNLPDDLHEEIFGQAFVELFEAGAAALAHRTGKAVFRRAILAAIRSVRASYAPPGKRTRASANAPGRKVAAEDVGRIADKETIQRCTVPDETGERSIDFDLFSDSNALSAQRDAEDRLTAEQILRHAPREVGVALRLIFLDDEPVETVANSLGITRFSLNRRITAFCSNCRLAA